MIQRTSNRAFPRTFRQGGNWRDARFDSTERTLAVRTGRAANFPNINSVQLTRNSLPNRYR